MEYGMEIINRYGLKIYDIDRNHIGQQAVVLAFRQAAREFPAPVEKASPVHVPIIPQLNLNVNPCAVFGYCADIKDTCLVTDNFCCECPLLHNLNCHKLLMSCLCQNCIQQRKELLFVALLTKSLPENKIIQRFEPAHNDISPTLHCYHTLWAVATFLKYNISESENQLTSFYTFLEIIKS